MERAKSHEIGAPLFELHIAAYDLHHIRAREQFLNECLGNGHGVIVETPAQGPKASIPGAFTSQTVENRLRVQEPELEVVAA